MQEHDRILKLLGRTDGIMSKDFVKALTGFSERRLKSLTKDGNFPEAVIVGSQNVGYKEIDFLNWLNSSSGINFNLLLVFRKLEKSFLSKII